MCEYRPIPIPREVNIYTVLVVDPSIQQILVKCLLDPRKTGLVPADTMENKTDVVFFLPTES